jgi:transcriptional regulator with XRE-family HTH domain
MKIYLKELRENRGLTQAELACMCGFESLAAISFWESGVRLPGAENIIKLCKALQCSSDQLLGLESTHSEELFSVGPNERVKFARNDGELMMSIDMPEDQSIERVEYFLQSDEVNRLGNICRRAQKSV